MATCPQFTLIGRQKRHAFCVSCVQQYHANVSLRYRGDGDRRTEDACLRSALDIYFVREWFVGKLTRLFQPSTDNSSTKRRLKAMSFCYVLLQMYNRQSVRCGYTYSWCQFLTYQDAWNKSMGECVAKTAPIIRSLTTIWTCCHFMSHSLYAIDVSILPLLVVHMSRMKGK